MTTPTPPSAPSLRSLTVLVIGASRGLGHAIAAEYLDRGARVVGTVRGDSRTTSTRPRRRSRPRSSPG